MKGFQDCSILRVLPLEQLCCEPVPLSTVAGQATVKDASDLAIARKSEKPQEHKGSETRNAERRGGIAQLGEHLLCKQGVKGSNPFISTIRADSSAG